jgi:tRNA(His) 5'-end guanylyltransferase
MVKISLGTRMKEYEASTNSKIICRVPIVMRIDGKKFSSLTKRLSSKKPFCETLAHIMTKSVMALATEMQGCMIGYTQSDEMTFIIRTDQSNETCPWFDNRIQKMDSVASSIVTAAFNRLMWSIYKFDITKENIPTAYFDCRIHPVPTMTEVVNNLIWRQIDCTKNSISSATDYEVGKKLGRGTARKLMHKLNQNERQELLFEKTGINWNNYPPEFKRGIVVFKKEMKVDSPHMVVTRKKWISGAAPIFSSEEGRVWLDNVLNIEQEE